MLTNSKVTVLRYAPAADRFYIIGTYPAWTRRKARVRVGESGEYRCDRFVVRIPLGAAAIGGGNAGGSGSISGVNGGNAGGSNISSVSGGNISGSGDIEVLLGDLVYFGETKSAGDETVMQSGKVSAVSINRFTKTAPHIKLEAEYEYR